MSDKMFSELKRSVFEANVDLSRSGLVKYAFGNVSGIDRENGVIAIKPSGVPYDKLTPDMIVVLDLDGKVIESDFRPSSDTDTHLALYRNLPKIAGVAHTHSQYATAWAQAELEIPCLGTTHADFCTHAIPCSTVLADEAIKNAYEYETGQQIVRTLLSLSNIETTMILVGGHGPFTWGDSPKQAVYHAVMLEEIAKLAYFTLILAPSKRPLKQTLIEKHYYRKHGKNAYYGQKKSL